MYKSVYGHYYSWRQPSPVCESFALRRIVVGWRNGNASVSGAEDSGFESQACRFLFLYFNCAEFICFMAA